MVAVLGLDRLDGTPIASMPDHLWSQHSAEITRRFEAHQQQMAYDAQMSHAMTGCALGFTDFCKTFATVGGNMTQAMRGHAAATATATAPPATVAGPAVTMMLDDGSNIVLGAPQPTPTPVARQPRAVVPAAVKTARGQGMAKSERKQLLADRMRKAGVDGVGDDGRGGQRRLVGGKGGLDPAWARGEIEPPAEEKNMGSWTARVYSAEAEQQQLQLQRLGVDGSSKPVYVAPGTFCPNSMNGPHCYQSRANVFTCTQCGAKR